jgi:hypothetical protein
MDVDKHYPMNKCPENILEISTSRAAGKKGAVIHGSILDSNSKLFKGPIMKMETTPFASAGYRE